MTERPSLVRPQFDFSRIGFDAPQITMAPTACRGADSSRGTAAAEPPFLVTRHLESTNPSAPVPADRLVVVPVGYVDVDTAPLLESALVNAVDSHPEVCCDLAAVSFFSAAGIRALLVARDRAGRSGSRFSIRGAAGITRRVLRITRVDRLLVIPEERPGWRPSDSGLTHTS